MPKINQHSVSAPSGRPRDALSDFHREPIVKLHESVQPEFLGLTSFKARKVKVKDSTLENLKLAQEAVLKAKHMLPYGAGNQKTDVSHTEGESWARRVMLRDNEFCENPVQHAQQVVRYQAGNCAEHSNVSYTLLAGKTLNAPLLRVTDSEQDHAYVLIGDPRDPQWGEKETVVVDAWVTHPSALTLEQSADLRPRMPPFFQRPPHSSPDPEASTAFDQVSTVSTEQVNSYLVRDGLPQIGRGLLDHIDSYVDTSRFFNEKTSARDPSTRYSSGVFSSKSMDKISRHTVEGENLAQTSWQNNGYRW